MADFDMTWAKMDPNHVLPEIDTTQPSVARVYDAILGGKDNFAVDRAVAAAAVKTMGDGGNGARLNRAALGRAPGDKSGTCIRWLDNLKSRLCHLHIRIHRQTQGRSH